MKKQKNPSVWAKYGEIIGLLSVVNVSAFIATYFGGNAIISAVTRGILYLSVSATVYFVLQAKDAWNKARKQ